MKHNINLKHRYWVFQSAPHDNAGGLDDVVFTTDDKQAAIEYSESDVYFVTPFDSIEREYIEMPNPLDDAQR